MSETRSSTRSNLIFFGLLAVVLVVYMFVLRPLNRGMQGASHPAIGAILPSLTLDPLDTRNEPLTSKNLAGKVVLINFWATWCGPCQHELPHLLALERKLRDNQDFQLVLIASPGGGETEAEMREATEAYLRQRNVDIATYIDPYGTAYQAVMRATAAQGGIPLSVVVDRKGVVQGLWEGYAPGTETDMEALIEELLARKS